MTAEPERVAGDQARASVLVAVPRAEAFRIFTEEIDQWWRRGLRYRVAGKRRGIVHIERGVGGRLFESFELSTGTKVIETGRVIAWDPPAKLVLEWRAVNFAPAEKTEVEVLFEERSGDRTYVTVTHRGWASIRPDHPARHGLDVPAFVRSTAIWWGDLLMSLRVRAAGGDGTD